MKSEAKLSRRVLMKALGMGIAAPLAFRLSQYATAATTRPKRLIVYYFPHGVPNEHMDMEPYLMPSNPLFKDYGADPAAPKGGVHVATDYTLQTRTAMNLLSPLEKYKSQLSVVRGLYQSGSFSTHDSIQAILTGNGTGSSLDQLVADQLSMRSQVLGVVTRVNASLDTTNGVLSRNAAGWRMPENDVVKAYDDLFGSLGGTPTEPVADETDFRNRTLDLTMSEVVELRKAVSGLTREENKLSSHLAALENIKAQGQGLGTGTGEACLVAPPVSHIDDLRAQKAAYVSNDQTEYWQDGSLSWKSSTADAKTNFTKLAEAQAELAAYATLCGQAQVVTVQNAWASADYPLPEILPSRPSDSYHVQVSHVGYDPSSINNQLRIDYATVQQWFMSRVARMCEILDQPDPFDPDHTALDNTMIYVCSEIGDGNLHTKSLERMWLGAEDQHIFGYFPAFVIGGGGGTLAPGRLITVDNRPTADLLLTLAQAMGSSITNFNGMSTGAIQELLV